MQLVPGARESLSQIAWQRFGVALSFRPRLNLTNQIRIDVSLVCQVVRYGAVYLFERKELEILANRLRIFAAPERMDDRIREIRLPAT
jgi:hypothetical protein